MTTLVLAIVQGPSQFGEARHISSGEFAIGRSSSSNDWVLDDLRFIVSKQHCILRQDDVGWWMIDRSRNGVILSRGNENWRIGREPERMASRDVLQIGPYELSVDLQEDEASFLLLPLMQHADRLSGRPQLSADRNLPTPLAVPPLTVKRLPVGPPRLSSAAGLSASLAAEPAAHLRDSTGPEVHREDSAALARLLKGAALQPEDGRGAIEADTFARVGSVLRAFVRGLRQMSGLSIGRATPGTRRDTPLDHVQDERAAVRWLIAGDPAHGEEPAENVGAIMRDLHLHQACVLQAAREAARDLFENLDPDEPEGRMLPVLLDLLPGWRHARARVFARRRYSRLKINLDRVLDRSFDRAYDRAWRDVCGRWDDR